MKLHIAGIDHYNPRCRKELLKWLSNLKQSHKTNPLFLATEWDQDVYLNIKKQREELKKILKKEFINISDEILNFASEMPAYEADTHKEIFTKNIPILWLDQNRENINWAFINSYATNKYTFSMYIVGT